MSEKRLSDIDGGDNKRSKPNDIIGEELKDLPTLPNDQLDEIFKDVPEVNIKEEFNIDIDQIAGDIGDTGTPNLDLPSNIGTPEPSGSLGNSVKSRVNSPMPGTVASNSSRPATPSSTINHNITNTTNPSTYPTSAPYNHNISKNGIAATSGYSYQNSNVHKPVTYNPKSGYVSTGTPINRMNPLVQQASGIHVNTASIDRATPASQHSQSKLYQGPNQTHSQAQSQTQNSNQNPNQKDPAKLNDVLAAAGVDIAQEEELLMQQHANRNNRYPGVNQAYNQSLSQSRAFPKSTPFLNQYHVSSFMSKVARENGIHQNFLQDPELLELMSAACEQWISNIITKTIILSRHRRRGIPTLVESKKKNGQTTTSTPSSQRSEISKELRNLAQRQKDLEEKRVQKRIALGLESSTFSGSDENGKAVAEDTLHRAANATAAMMSSSRKKYSWMTSGNTAPGEEKASDNMNKQSSIIAIRGDNGLRYREIRTGKSVTMKDLLKVLEDEKIGTQKALLKGYARLKD